MRAKEEPLIYFPNLLFFFFFFRCVNQTTEFARDSPSVMCILVSSTQQILLCCALEQSVNDSKNLVCSQDRMQVVQHNGMCRSCKLKEWVCSICNWISSYVRINADCLSDWAVTVCKLSLTVWQLLRSKNKKDYLQKLEQLVLCFIKWQWI